VEHDAGIAASRACRGFTLLEILVSLAILSVVLAAVYSTFFLARRAVDGMDDTLVKLQEARRALDILRCEVEASFYEAADKSTAWRVKDRDYYGKSASSLRFATFSALRPGLSLVSYYVEGADDGLRLFKKIGPLRLTEEDAEAVEVIDRLDAFSIEAKYQDGWVRTWDTDIIGRVPEEVRISIAVKLRSGVVVLADRAMPRIKGPI